MRVRFFYMHAIQLCNLVLMGIILFRGSIGHQRRLNWFFGAIAVITVTSKLLVFQRFFGTDGSLINNVFNLIVLSLYFLIYLIKTWKVSKEVSKTKLKDSLHENT